MVSAPLHFIPHPDPVEGEVCNPRKAEDGPKQKGSSDQCPGTLWAHTLPILSVEGDKEWFISLYWMLSEIPLNSFWMNHLHTLLLFTAIFTAIFLTLLEKALMDRGWLMWTKEKWWEVQSLKRLKWGFIGTYPFVESSKKFDVRLEMFSCLFKSLVI